MKSNYDKLVLGATLSSMDGDNHNHGDCFNYGSVGGCDEGCPALLDGRCEIPNEAIKVCDISENEREEILKLYSQADTDQSRIS